MWFGTRASYELLSLLALPPPPNQRGTSLCIKMAIIGEVLFSSLCMCPGHEPHQLFLRRSSGLCQRASWCDHGRPEHSQQPLVRVWHAPVHDWAPSATARAVHLMSRESLRDAPHRFAGWVPEGQNCGSGDYWLLVKLVGKKLFPICSGVWIP